MDKRISIVVHDTRQNMPATSFSTCLVAQGREEKRRKRKGKKGGREEELNTWKDSLHVYMTPMYTAHTHTHTYTHTFTHVHTHTHTPQTHINRFTHTTYTYHKHTHTHTHTHTHPHTQHTHTHTQHTQPCTCMVHVLSLPVKQQISLEWFKCFRFCFAHNKIQQRY